MCAERGAVALLKCDFCMTKGLQVVNFIAGLHPASPGAELAPPAENCHECVLSEKIATYKKLRTAFATAL